MVPVRALALAALLLLAGCETLDSLNPFSGGGKAKLTELEPIQPSADLRLLWQASVGSAGTQVLVPALVGETTYAAASDGTLMRLEGGQPAWKINVGQPLSGGVGADGKRVLVGTPEGEVLAYDSDGRPLWKARVSSEVLSPPALAGDLAVARSGDSRVFGLSAIDGKRRWVFQRSAPPLSLRAAAGVALTEKALLAGFPGGKLVAIGLSNGAALWEATVAQPRGATELERVADVTSAPSIEGRTVCAVAYQGRVACFDSDNGNSLWAKDLSSSAGLDGDERYLYVTDDKGNVQAFDRATGASIWKQVKLAGRGVGRPLAVGAHVAVGDSRGFVHLLRRSDGAFAARLPTDGSAIVADLRRRDEGFVVQTSKGGLFALAAR
jgi:outer membrane protein assembly factor BamB